MINFIDRALERHLREKVPLRESTIGVSFDPPDKDWGAGLSRPTVNVFLWDVSRAARSSSTGLSHRQAEQGVERRRANPEVDLHYLVTAWATDVNDEHQVLGAVLQAILRHRQLPSELLPAGTVDGSCRLALEQPEHRMPGEFWSALGGRLKPGLQLRVTVPLPVYEWAATAPPPTSIDLGMDPMAAPPAEALPAARWAPAGATSPRRVRRNGVITSEGRATGAAAADSDPQPG